MPSCRHSNSTSIQHYCETCYEKVSECYDDDHDGWCDECWMEVEFECLHEGMEGEHVCYYCYAYLGDCVDEDGDGQCDLSEMFPHFIWDRN